MVPDDKIFLHRLNGVDINDRIQFNRVLLCGTPKDTLIGRPFLPGVTVTAAVEEHIRDSTVYIYKRRRAKGYRRFRGFRAVRVLRQTVLRRSIVEDDRCNLAWQVCPVGTIDVRQAALSHQLWHTVSQRSM